MRHRLLASVTASALVLSSLVLGAYAAQADDGDNTVIVQIDQGTSVDETTPADATPILGDDSTPVVPEDDASSAPADDAVNPETEPTDDPSAEPTDDPSAAPDSAPIASPVAADDTVATDDQTNTTVTVTGKITPIGLANTYVWVCQVQGGSTDCQDEIPADDGSYSAQVAPGSSVYIEATADGYLWTWVGGRTDINYRYYYSSDADVIMTAPQSGTWTVDDLVLQKAGSISGKLILPDGYTFTGDQGASAVYVYEVFSDGTVSSSPTTNTWITNDGTYTFKSLNPGTQYHITVQPQYLNVSPSNDFVSTDYDGFVTATTAGTTGVDVILTTGARITGTITPANASSAYVYACEITGNPGDSYRDTSNCVYVNLNNGSYSVAVSPGATVDIYATANGYLPTYVGGYADTYTPYNQVNDSITLITTSPQGGIVSGQNIALKQAGSISGSVILPDGYTYTPGVWNNALQVTAYPVDRSSGSPQITGSSVTTYVSGYSATRTTAPYTFTNLVPGREYAVMVSSTSLTIDQPNDLLPTYAGGYASAGGVSYTDPARSDVRLVTATVAGATDDNITMAKGTIVSGTITPKDASNKQVWVCEVVSDSNYTNVSNCQTPRVNSDGTYSVGVTPGASAVIQAKADNYLYTWLGGYSNINDQRYGNPRDGMTQVAVPATGQNVNLSPAAIISGTLSLPVGYRLSYGFVEATEVVQGDNGPTLGDSKSVQIYSDGHYRIEVKPGATYIVDAESGSQYLSQGNKSDLLTAVAGGYQTESSYISSSIDLSDPLIEKVVMTSDKTVNLTMTTGAKITGTVYMPDGTPANFGNNGYAYVRCIVASSFTNLNSNYQSTSSSVANDGSYSCTVVPGRTYIVNAYAYTYSDTNYKSYPTTWVGGFLGSNPTLPNASVTQITAPSIGQSTTGQDIRLSDGSSISGKLIGYVPDPDDPYAVVQACVLNSDGSTSDCTYTTTVNSDGTYSLKGLIPGANTVVQALASGYQTTWYGGYVGYPESLPDPLVTQFTSAAVGGNVPNINITLVKPVTITGSVLPSSVVSDNGGLYVYACQTYAQSGQNYYRTSLDACLYTWVPSDSTSYSIQVNPGVSYALIAQADGYTDAWHGGYSGDSGIDQNSAVPTSDRVLPSASTIQLVSGTAGQRMDNVNIQFGQQAAQSVTLTFNSQGGRPAASITATAGDSVTLPSSSKAQSLFMGWYTQPDGDGTQASSPMTVTASTTLYAYWTAAPDSVVEKEIVSPELTVTGGMARAASGSDPYTLVTTLTDQYDDPVMGLADHLTAVPPANVTVSNFTDNGDGTYSMNASGSVPGNYEITVLLDGNPVPGSPIPVNFIGATIDEPVRILGDQQAADGLGFLPYEWVDVVVHSDPINIGRVQADSLGRVPVTFEVPKDFDLGRHSVAFTGVTSGTATVTFSVATPTASSDKIKGETGGTVVTPHNHGSLLVLAGVLIIAGLVVQRLRTRTTKRG